MLLSQLTHVFRCRPRSRRLQTRVLAGLALAILVGAFGLLTAGCNESQPDVIYEALVAPPNVPPKVNRSAAHVVIDLQAKEEVKQIAPGVDYNVWSFNGSVPGPMARVQVGDTVEIRLQNSSDNKNTHNIDLHAVNGPGGGAGATNVAPGETKAFTFKATSPGLFTYHCAQGIVADHIANGMYGAILVEQPGAPKLYNREYYLGQSEFYLTDQLGQSGLPELDLDKLLAEQPTYVTWNGATDAVVGDNALQADVGDTVRLYVTNGGPNYTSSFHVIGEIMDRVYQWGSLANPPLKGIQTISIPPGDAVIADMKLDVPGDYKIVDHAIGRLTKGSLAILTATGADDFDTFRDLQKNPPADGGTVQVEPTPTAEATAPPAATEDVNVTLDDSFFDPAGITVKAGSQVTFHLSNVGTLPHNMHIPDSNGSFDGGTVSTPDLVTSGQTAELTWTAPSARGVTLTFRCDVHPVDMTGTITTE